MANVLYIETITIAASATGNIPTPAGQEVSKWDIYFTGTGATSVLAEVAGVHRTLGTAKVAADVDQYNRGAVTNWRFTETGAVNPITITVVGYSG